MKVLDENPKLVEKLKIDDEIRNLWSESVHYRNQRQTSKKTDEIYDFIIVGAGTAGCVLARELVYNIPNINILVLEAGPPGTQVNDKMVPPSAFRTIFRLSETDWGYFTEDQTMSGIIDPSKKLLNKGTAYPRGKVVGGCSVVNGMVYIRGNKADYDAWAAQGPDYKIWDFDNCLEAFKATENNVRENPDEEFKKYHGSNGLLHVQDSPNDSYEILKDVFEIAKNLGIPYNNDFNGAKQNGMGIHQQTVKDGKRCSLADCYLADALRKVEACPLKGSQVLPKFAAVNVKSSAHMLNIIWDEENENENIAIGVKYFCNGGVHNAFIAPKGEVILCGGSINSAQILMLSGIGPKDNLKSNNIEVRKELPVGRNLLDHPLCNVSAKVSVPNSTAVSKFHWGSGLELGIFLKGNDEGKFPSQEEFLDEHPDMQVFVIADIVDPDIIKIIRSDPSIPKFEAITLVSVLNLPSSVGHLELRSSNPFLPPKIFVNFYEKPDDLYRMISVLKLFREMFKQPPLNTVWGVKEIGFNDEFGKWCNVGDEMSDEDWELFIRAKSHTSYHPCGTVKMASESNGGCVNHRLQVYGTKNLRVVDASIFPTIPSGNINAPTAMVAWKASRLIEEDYNS